MPIGATINGSPFTIPEPGDTNWGANATAYLQALATGLLQSGGSVPFTFLVSASANPATGVTANTVLRLAKNDSIAWRNNANSGDVRLFHDNTNDNVYIANAANTLFTQLDGQAFARYTQPTSGQAVALNTNTIINYGTSVKDTDGAVTTGAGWKFTVPAGKGGQYAVSAGVNFTASISQQLFINVNGAIVYRGDSFTGSVYHTNGVVDVLPGDQINVAVFGAAATVAAGSDFNYITIKRLV